MAGLAGRHGAGLPEGVPQLTPGGPAGQPGAREGAAAGQAGRPRRLPGGQERRHLGPSARAALHAPPTRVQSGGPPPHPQDPSRPPAPLPVPTPRCLHATCPGGRWTLLLPLTARRLGAWVCGEPRSCSRGLRPGAESPYCGCWLEGAGLVLRGGCGDSASSVVPSLPQDWPVCPSHCAALWGEAAQQVQPRVSACGCARVCTCDCMSP